MTDIFTLDRDAFAAARHVAQADRRQAYVAELAEARDNLREAEQAFRTEIRATVDGACSARGALDIDDDLDDLVEVGRSIGRAAKGLQLTAMRGRTWAASAPAKLSATLMAEALDGQLPGHAWAVVAAAAELEAVEP